MQHMRFLIIVLAVAILGLAAYAVGDPTRPLEVERIDLGVGAAEPGEPYDARLEPASDAPIKEFRIPITHSTIEIAPGVEYAGWTFGGQVPGRALRVREGDRVRVKLVNEAPMAHSIDFHSARIPWDEAYQSIGPGEELTFEFTAADPGAYLVHCGTPPVLMHIMQGLYLPIIVDPREGWGTEADKEFVLVQSEFYADSPDAGEPRGPDWDAALSHQPGHVTFNGTAFQYKNEPLRVDEGDRARFFVVNAGPNLRSDFHIVGAIFDRVYPDGNPDHALESVQTWTVPAGGGAVFETVFERGGSGEGLYPFVTHAFADAEKGAVGLVRVGPRAVADDD